MDAEQAYQALIAHQRRLATLVGVAALSSWDQECLLPPAAAPHRAEQQALLAGLLHEGQVDPRIGEWLANCEGSDLIADPTAPPAVNLRRWRHAYDRTVKLPQDLVTALSRARSQAYEAWKGARAAADPTLFAPALQRILDLIREKADALGHDGERYDALLEGYEPGTTTAQVGGLLEPLAAELAVLLRQVERRPPPLPTGSWSQTGQQVLCEAVLDGVGFDRRRGRLDPTVHPFCTTLGPDDVRLTTRFRADDPLEALYCSLHEAGHGLYEQGFAAEHWGTPMARSVSLGVHESQSRFWENMIGRSHGFCRWLQPLLQHHCPATPAWSVDGLHRILTAVEPGFIRVDADEVCYNLHIVLRFEIERRLLAGELSVVDLPEAWNARFTELFDRRVPDAAQGCLQDVHWSHAGIGYFPTYTIGNCYAAMLGEAAGRSLGDLDELAGRGEFAPILAWLRSEVHAHGCRYEAPELIHRVTGEAPSSAALLRHLRRRYL